MNGKPAPGTLYWSREPYDTGKKTYQVFGRATPIDTEVDGKIDWLYRPPPAEYTKIVEALQAGKVVTFPEPLFRLGNTGEVIGLTKPCFLFRSNDGRAVLHWEVLAPVSSDKKSALRDLIKLVGDNIPALESIFTNNEIAEIKDDNFLSADELSSKLLPKLESKEQTLIGSDFSLSDEVIDLRIHRKMLNRLLHDYPTFAVGKDYNGSKGAELDRCYAYPLKLEIETDLLPSPSDNADGGPYTLQVEYQFASGAPVVDTVSIDSALFGKQVADPADGAKKVVPIWLKVPAKALSMKLSTEGEAVTFSAPRRTDPEADVALVQALAPYRWRRILLSHLNEWAPASVDALFKTLKDKKVVPSTFDVDSVKPLAWWHQDYGVLRNLGIGLDKPPEIQPVAPTNRRDGSLFSTANDQLLKDTKIDNLHPVMVVSLLELLCGQRGVLSPKTSWPVGDFYSKPEPPFAWGWLYDTTPALGDKVGMIVVCHDYAYDRSKTAEVVVSIGSEDYTLYSGLVGQNGFLFQEVEVTFWGSCKLGVKGAASSPKTTLNSVLLDIPKPELDPLTQLERNSGAFKTIKAGNKFVVPVRLKDAPVMPKKIDGVIGIELQKGDPKAPWKPAQIAGEPTFIRAEAKPTPDDSTIGGIDESVFLVKDHQVIGVTAKGRKAGVDKLNITPRVSYEALRQQQINGGVTIGVAMVVRLQKLSAAVGVGLKATELSRLGESCIVIVCTDELAKIKKALENALKLFSKVYIPGETTPLIPPKSLESAPILAQIHKLGLRVTVDSPESFAIANIANPNMFLPGIECSFYGVFITNVVADAKLNPKGKITNSFGFGELKSALNPNLSVRLVQGIDRIIASGKAALPSTIDASGNCCVYAFDSATRAAALSEFALAQPLFAEVVHDTEKHQVKLVAAGPHTYFAVVDPTPAFAQIYADATADGKDAAYRFYFSPINGLSLSTIKGRELGALCKKSELPNIDGGGLGAPVYGYEGEVDSLRVLSFGDIRVKLIGGNAHVICSLVGNRASWDPFKIKVTQSIGGNETGANPNVKTGDANIAVDIPLPRNATGTATEAAANAVNPVAWGAPPAKTKTFDFTAALDGDGKGLFVREHGLFDLLVSCKTRGIAAPMEGSVTFWLACLAVAVDTVQRDKTLGHELTLEVTPAVTPKPLKVSYVVSAAGKVGYVNHDGEFIAFLRNARAMMTAGTTYTITLKCAIKVRGKNLTPSTLSTTYTMPRQ